jgi:single-strand DNA-binding protein
MNTLKNSVQLIGHIGKDIELRTFDNGKKLARITLATNEYFKDGKGEKRQETQWHNLTAWGTLADNISSTLTKGNEVAINGKLVYKSYEDKSGATRYVAEIVVNEFMRISKYEKAF